MGDFTSRGAADALRGALNHMSWLCKSDRSVNSRPLLLAVPGNHDVNREDAINLGQFGKFDRFREYSNEALFYSPPVDGVAEVPIGSASSGIIHIFLVNTTLGSWEPYLLPPELQHVIHEPLDKNLTLSDLSKVNVQPAAPRAEGDKKGYYDQLDTPYVAAVAIQRLGEIIETIPRKDAIVIIGHHNILPQEQPRLASYAELLNAGYLRRFLLSLGRPVIYLHGHTHHYLFEEVSCTIPNAKLVCIASPQIGDGFNEISIYFDEQRCVLGMRLLPWRISQDRGKFSAETQNQIAVSLQDGTSQHPTKSAGLVFSSLVAGQRYSLRDIETILSSNTNAPQPIHLDEIVLELLFRKWVEIDNLSHSHDEWIVRVPSKNGSA